MAGIMTSKTLIDVTGKAVRAAILDDGVPVEFHVLPKDGDVTGPLYLARVRKVDNKLKAAFLDLGDREAFLPLRHAKALKDGNPSTMNQIVHEGELVLVKIVSESPEEGKLPIATANPMIAGRYALSGHLKGGALLARTIGEGEEKEALLDILDEMENGHSLIIRSNAAGSDPKQIRGEIESQQDLWKSLELKKDGPGIVLPALDPIEKALRDYAPSDAGEILVSDRAAFLKAEKIAQEKWPDLQGKIRLYSEATPIMEAFSVEDKLAASIDGFIPLPSGGNLKIEETSAMTVVDVNSGTGRKGTAPETLHLATNLEAAKAIAREIRFQNLGGLITVDFIDMRKHDDREKVLQVLGQELAKDHMATEHTPINRFGLLTIKRRRRGLSLKQALEEK